MENFNVHISKAGKCLAVDFASMPENAQRMIIAYGLKQKLNDCGASATKKLLGKEEAAAQSLAAAENMIEALMSGNITVRQAASGVSLFERKLRQVIAKFYKKILDKKLEDEMDNAAAIAGIAQKLKREPEAILAAFTKQAEILVKEAERIAAIKAESADLSDFDI